MPPKQKQEGSRKGKSRSLSSETSVVSIVPEQHIQDSTIASRYSTEESSTPEQPDQDNLTAVTPSTSPTSKTPSVDSSLTSSAPTISVNIITTSATPTSPLTYKPPVFSKKAPKPTASLTPPTTTTTATTTNSDPPSTPLEQSASPRILLNPPPSRSQVRNRRRQSIRDKSSTTTTPNRASSSSSTFANGSEGVEMKQGWRYPNPRNHPALRRILREEVPHLVLPPHLPVSGVGGWGEALKKEKVANIDDETGIATGTETSSRSVMNVVAERKRSRFETWEEQDENEDDGDDDGYDEGTEDNEVSSTSASATLSASNLTSTTYTFYVPPGVDPAYPHGFSGLICVPTPSTTTAATCTTTADATEATADGATSTDSTSKTSPSLSTTSTTSSASGSEDSPEPEQSTDQSQSSPALLTNPKSTVHGALASLVAAIGQHLLSSDSSSPSTGPLIEDTSVESPSVAHLHQIRLTIVVGSGSCSGTTAFFTTPSVTFPVPTRASIIGGDRGDPTAATACSKDEAQRQQQKREQDLPQELRLSMTFQAEQHADQSRHTILQEIEVLPVFRDQSESPASSSLSPSSQSRVSVSGHRTKRQRVNIRKVVTDAVVAVAQGTMLGGLLWMASSEKGHQFAGLLWQLIQHRMQAYFLGQSDYQSDHHHHPSPSPPLPSY